MQRLFCWTIRLRRRHEQLLRRRLRPWKIHDGQHCRGPSSQRLLKLCGGQVWRRRIANECLLRRLRKREIFDRQHQRRPIGKQLHPL